MEYRRGRDRTLLCLDVCCPDYLAPFFGFLDDELTEVGGRTRERRPAEVGKPCLDLGLGEGSIDLTIELVDDFNGRILGCYNSLPPGCFVTRHKFTYRWYVWQQR